MLRLIVGQKELLNLFNVLLDIILTDKTLMSSKDENEKLKEEKENKNENENENENENVNENDETLMSSNEDDGTMRQNEIKKLNDYLDKIIDKSKSFEDQIKSLEKVENLGEYYFINDFDDKELESKIFKLKLAHLSNIIDKKSFEQTFAHALVKLADKLINTTNKEENQITVNNINKNKDKRFKMDDFNDWVIQSSDRCINLKDAVDLILDFN